MRPPDTITVRPREAAAAALEQYRAEREHEQAIAEQRAVVERDGRRSLRDWTEDVPTARNGRLRFEDFTFQEELYGVAATHDREMVIQKCTQGGFSEWAVRWTLFHADRGRTAMYVMPEQESLKAFSNMRIKPVFRNSGYLRGRTADDAVDNVTLKQVGLGWVAFRGSNAETGLMSVDADVLVLDENDKLVQENIGEAEQRVTGPLSAGLIRRLGVPTDDGWGIAKHYNESDQRVWTVRCDECGTQNPLHGREGWDANVDKVRARVICRRCREPIDVRRGQWIARFHGREVAGFHMPKYAIFGVNIAGIVERSKKRRPLDVEKFHRNDLGIGYTAADARLSIDALRACVRPDLPVLQGLTTSRLVTMGVDAKGRGVLHVTISEHIDEYRKAKRAVLLLEDGADGTAWNQLVAVMGRFGVNMAVVDHMPEWQQAASFCNRFPGRAYALSFLTGKGARHAAKLDVPMKVEEDERRVLVRRTQVLDTMLTNFRQQFVLLPDLDKLPDEYGPHLQALTRTKEEKPAGELDVFYKSVGPDDFGMAEAYDVVATELWYRQRGIEMVQFATGQAQPTNDAIDFVAGQSIPEALRPPDPDEYRAGGDDEYRPGFGGEDGWGTDLDA